MSSLPGSLPGDLCTGRAHTNRMWVPRSLGTGQAHSQGHTTRDSDLQRARVRSSWWAHLQGSVDVGQHLRRLRPLLQVLLHQVVLPGPPDDLQGEGAPWGEGKGEAPCARSRPCSRPAAEQGMEDKAGKRGPGAGSSLLHALQPWGPPAQGVVTTDTRPAQRQAQRPRLSRASRGLRQLPSQGHWAGPLYQRQSVQAALPPGAEARGGIRGPYMATAQQPMWGHPAAHAWLGPRGHVGHPATSVQPGLKPVGCPLRPGRQLWS